MGSKISLLLWKGTFVFNQAEILISEQLTNYKDEFGYLASQSDVLMLDGGTQRILWA